MPVTRPDEETVAFETSVLYQKPPGIELLSEVVRPIQTDVPPEIEGTAGRDKTFMVVVARPLVPQKKGITKISFANTRSNPVEKPKVAN